MRKTGPAATAECGRNFMKGGPEEMRRIGQMLLKLFEHWQLNTPQQLSLLGLDRESHIDPNEYLSLGSWAVDRDKLDRASILLGIHKSLRLLFPGNRDLAYQWISQPNKRFDGLTPVEIVEHHGILGMHMVRGYLDQQLSSEELAFDKLIKASPTPGLADDQDDIELLSVTDIDKEPPEFLLGNDTEGVLQVLDVWTVALSIFSGEEKAKLWLMSHVPALGCAPADLLSTNSGRKKLLGVLRRIEKGDFAG